MPPTFSRVVPEGGNDTAHISRIENVLRRFQSRQETRRIIGAQSDAAKDRSVAGGTIAALLGNKDPVDVMKKARERFRCISWNVLKERPEIILGGGTLDQVGAGDANLH